MTRRTPPPSYRMSDGHPDGLLDTKERVRSVDLEHDEADLRELEPGALSKLWTGVVTLAALIGLSYAVPGLEAAQPWQAGEGYVPFWNLIGRELLGEGAEAKGAAEELEGAQAIADAAEAAPKIVVDRKPVKKVDREAGYPAYKPTEDEPEAPEVGIEFVDRLSYFYRKLTHTDLAMKGAVTRASHWGDSVLGNDGITYAIRLRMQSRFGDAGHGFHALAQYDPSYRHQGLRFTERAPWSKCYIIRGCKKDGHYGYGGTTVWSAGGAESRFRTTDKTPVGHKVSSFELWYASAPKGGKLQVKVDKGDAQIVETAADELGDGWRRFSVEDGPHDFSVRAVGGGRARAYGVVLEREGPGVVWDGMALIGSFLKRMNNFEADHIKRQVAHRDADLLVFTFGGNDMLRDRSDLRKTMDPLIEEYREVLRRVRAGKPEASCLVMAPIDHGERKRGRVVTREVVPRMVEAQRKVAELEGCAFFDTFAAMGGEGSMARWVRAKPRLGSGDLSHATRRGHEVIGELFFRALLVGYREYRSSIEGQPIPKDLDADTLP